MDRLNERLRALGERARAEVEMTGPRTPPVRRVRRQRLAVLGAVAGLALFVFAASAWFLTRQESPAEVVAKDDWVTVGSVEEVKERSVVYVEDHQVFVVQMGKEGFIALSAWAPSPAADGERHRMLFCTLSNLFESEEGGVFARNGALLESRLDGMPSVELRIREQMVEIAPKQVSTNNSEPFGGAAGPPCGEWGPVVEGPSGFALASDAPPDENKASLQPARVKAGEHAELHFAPGRQTSGLRWDLYHFEDPLWRWAGILVAGPGYTSYFDLARWTLAEESTTSVSAASIRWTSRFPNSNRGRTDLRLTP